MVHKYFLWTLISILLVFVGRPQATEEQKICRFMSPHLAGQARLETRPFWNQLTGFFCYFYMNDDNLKFRYPAKNIKYMNSTVIGTRINDTSYFWYDYRNKTSLSYIKPSFVNDIFYEKWKICSRDAVECCDNFMTSENIYPSDEYPCPAVWDSWSCFAPAKANSISGVLCPVNTFSSQSRMCELKSERRCLSDGTWNNKTDYTVCALAPTLRRRYDFNMIVLIVTTVLAFPALVILFSFRTLRQKLLFVLHRNLIFIIIIRNLLTIMTKELIIKNELNPTGPNTVMDFNSVACRVLAFFENVAKNGIFAFMFADGFYLHQTIVRPFANEPRLLPIYSAVFILSVLPSLIWALLRGIHDTGYCWMVDNTQDHWVTDGFRLVILGINTLLLFDIIRVMILKLKGGGLSQQTRTTVRVTLFLIPLFGIHIILVANRNIVPDNTCASQDVYYYISYLIEGFQGIMVAILFCYINPEVHQELFNAIRKLIVYLQQRFCANQRRDELFKRRPTTSTYVECLE